ncbi:uncharacterized protein LOC118750615 [Rhagoletis pomonella]|uniref:uncharacterized protein LOC118750590 n=1 Tax=Rhagoletis pomonella TaxID=28610 RepID=UPI0017876811|nr:uncharacterized protein LOC118750590 [Rhagoletis pomonella]XP_036341227.1 uncharacterized protein LOC118750596 [Rhagoletis pomonella]XP_036341240.1 uncharacterized protein LOC118750608 [Rhagoletis pomonella]XP_036341246.1 uncharacterized protein LOC118750615 [Rhagoletis pomonella]
MLNRKRMTFFNREKIRSELTTLNYVEARRLNGPIYCALVKELYEEGCRISARHLENLAEKETFFYETKVIRDRVCDNRDLLMALFDNMRVAEKMQIVEQAERYQTTVKCLYQIIQLLEPYKISFDWLLAHIYSIIIPICEHIESINEPNTKETIARIYFKTAKFHSLRENSLPIAIKFMEKAMELSRNEAWLSEYVTEREWGVYPTLHLVAGREVACLFLKYAKSVASLDSKAAEEAAQKAAISLAEVGIEKNKLEYIRALISRAKYMLNSENYESSSKLLLRVQKDLAKDTTVTEPKIFCDLYLYEGICLWNQKDINSAIAKLKEALKFAIKSLSQRREAEVCVAIGKIYASKMDTESQRTAFNAFMRAKQIFGKLGDALNRKKAHYMLAKLKADKIFPSLMDLLKNSQEKACGFYNLRQWKNSCKAFWNTMGVEELKKDKIYCLLEDKIEDTFAWEDNEFV